MHYATAVAFALGLAGLADAAPGLSDRLARDIANTEARNIPANILAPLPGPNADEWWSNTAEKRDAYSVKWSKRTTAGADDSDAAASGQEGVMHGD